MRRGTALPMPVARRSTLRVRPLQRTLVPLAVWVGVLGLAVAALLPVLQTSDATATAAEVRTLEHSRDRLQADVRLLASQVGELTAITRLERVARERLGLTPARPTVVLEVDQPPPGRILPSRFLPRQASETERRTLPWWQDLLEWVVVR